MGKLVMQNTVNVKQKKSREFQFRFEHKEFAITNYYRHNSETVKGRGENREDVKKIKKVAVISIECERVINKKGQYMVARVKATRRILGGPLIVFIRYKTTITMMLGNVLHACVSRNEDKK